MSCVWCGVAHGVWMKEEEKKNNIINSNTLNLMAFVYTNEFIFGFLCVWFAAVLTAECVVVV